jgi:hypothetical protein
MVTISAFSGTGCRLEFSPVGAASLCVYGSPTPPTLNAANLSANAWANGSYRLNYFAQHPSFSDTAMYILADSVLTEYAWTGPPRTNATPTARGSGGGDPGILAATPVPYQCSDGTSGWWYLGPPTCTLPARPLLSPTSCRYAVPCDYDVVESAGAPCFLSMRETAWNQLVAANVVFLGGSNEFLPDGISAADVTGISLSTQVYRQLVASIGCSVPVECAATGEMGLPVQLEFFTVVVSTRLVVVDSVPYIALQIVPVYEPHFFIGSFPIYTHPNTVLVPSGTGWQVCDLAATVAGGFDANIEIAV